MNSMPETAENVDFKSLQNLPVKVADLQPDLVPQSDVPLQVSGEAKLLGKFLSEVLERLDSDNKHLSAWHSITRDYNVGLLVPELLALRGPRSERTLRIWLKVYLDNDCDVFALFTKRQELPQRKVSSLEQIFLLSILLTPRRVKIYPAIRRMKSLASLGQLESESSIPTLVLWCQEWAAANPAVWAQAWMGSKFVAEHVVKSICRDSSLLEVGDVWVADVHRLAFDIISPISGKPARLLLILVIDWASRYPVGASIAVNEDSQHILAAFRNGFLHWGGLPKHVYLDKGKAFRAKLFHDWEKHDLTGELGGIFPRLGIGVTFAQAYNARAKVIERFFLTFQEHFERFVTSLRGANIADKPANILRNKLWANKLFDDTPPTLSEALRMMNFYFRHIYGEARHGALKGRSPWQVFTSKPVPEERKIEPAKLNFMLLTTSRKRIRSDGIRLNNCLYWHEALIDHVGQAALIRFDYADARWNMVYDARVNYICQAEIRQTQHPFVKLDTSGPQSHARLQQEYRQIKKLQRDTEERARQAIHQAQQIVDKALKPLLIEPSTPVFGLDNPSNSAMLISDLREDSMANNEDKLLNAANHKHTDRVEDNTSKAQECTEYGAGMATSEFTEM